MQTLFPLNEGAHSALDIPGLSYRPSYVDGKVEFELVAAIDREPWDTTWKRRRQPYGAAYGKQGSDRRPIPNWAQFLVEQLYNEEITDRPFDQMLVNEYFPGQG